MVIQESDEEWDLIDENPYSALVYKIYKSLTDVYGFYIAYVDELTSNNDELINTDADMYGGSGVGNMGAVTAEPIPWGGQPFSAEVTLPPLGGVWLVPDE